MIAAIIVGAVILLALIIKGIAKPRGFRLYKEELPGELGIHKDHGKTIATITTTMEVITIMTAAAAVRVQTAAALAVQALAAGVGAAAANKVKKLV
jgi:hypothetical protein